MRLPLRSALVAFLVAGPACVGDLYLGYNTGSETGGASACEPGTTSSCYGGPPGTEGVGTCKAGTRTCSTDGMGYGPCVGEVLPKPEDCASAMDQNCDGIVPPCKGSLQWAKEFGDASEQVPQGIAADGIGNVFITGDITGAANFGSGPLQSAGGADIFLAKLDAGGGHVWSKRFGDASPNQVGTSVAVDGDGNAVITGYFDGAPDFGGGPLQCAGSYDVFVAKLDASGTHLWSKSFGDAEDQGATSVAVDSAGNVLLTGTLSGAADFGGGPIQSAGASDIFLAKLDSSGNHLWSKHFGDSTDQAGVSLATDSAGNVLLTGTFDGAVDFGGGPLVAVGVFNMFVAKFDPQGEQLWSKRFGSTSPHGLAVDASGNVLVTGTLFDATDFGGGPLKSAGLSDIFLAKFDAAGNHLWSKRFGDGSMQTGQAVAADDAGNVLLSGSIWGAADFGGGPLPSAGKDDIFLAKFDAGGGHLWSKRFGDIGEQVGRGVAADGSGNVFVTGTSSGTVDFGAGSLIGAGGTDIVVAKFAP